MDLSIPPVPKPVGNEQGYPGLSWSFVHRIWAWGLGSVVLHEGQISQTPTVCEFHLKEKKLRDSGEFLLNPNWDTEMNGLFYNNVYYQFNREDMFRCLVKDLFFILLK